MASPKERQDRQVEEHAATDERRAESERPRKHDTHDYDESRSRMTLDVLPLKMQAVGLNLRHKKSRPRGGFDGVSDLVVAYFLLIGCVSGSLLPISSSLPRPVG